ncbi:MAG: hypothetical protein M1833_006433, partial [Piccolia ochrophora]
MEHMEGFTASPQPTLVSNGEDFDPTADPLADPMVEAPDDFGFAGAAGDTRRPSGKRQVLSCTKCRKRKVRCDRIQPCRACCVRGEPRECVFLVGDDQDYEPIRQVYEITGLRKENIRLKERLRQKAFKNDPEDDGEETFGPKVPPRVPNKPFRFQQRRFKGTDPSDNLYFGSPGLANVVSDFANMQISSNSTKPITYAAPRGVDLFAFQDAPLYAFPTLWPAYGGASSLLVCLPPEEELYGYLDAFQRRAQSCSFPHVPEEITRIEIERFLADKEGNAFKHPDMLALIFAALAQGLQNGVYDKFGGQWVEGGMAAEGWKGDLYISAAMQALRLASFMNRPTLLGIQTLIMIGPYLTNSGKFLDAWALFGTTIRLAQSIGLHRNPKYLDPAPPLRECSIRQALWWWMLHMDQQYSMTLGRPLGISGIGDCPPPEPLSTDPVILRLSEYINHFTISARQILSSDRLTNDKIDSFTDKLLHLRTFLPDVVRFDETWLDPNKELPPWPLDAMAAVFHGKTHNYLILLNRQRSETAAKPQSPTERSPTTVSPPSTSTQTARGRACVLASARALLQAFQFFHTRVRAAMICWTMGQQAFNAAMILALALLHPVPGHEPAPDADTIHDDALAVQRAYVAFREMEHKGVHKLAGVACAKLSPLIMQLDEAADRAAAGFPSQAPAPHPYGVTTHQTDVHNVFNPAPAADPMYTRPHADLKTEPADDFPADDAVMGNTGMVLLEDPGLQGFIAEGFAPLSFHMAGGDLPPNSMGMGSPGWAARPAPLGGYAAPPSYQQRPGQQPLQPLPRQRSGRQQQQQVPIERGESSGSAQGQRGPPVVSKPEVLGMAGGVSE